MTIFSVRHITAYRYRREVDFGEHRLMFRPRDSFDQRLIEASLTTYPEQSHVRWIHDVFGNCVALVDFSRPSSELRFETWITLDHTPQLAPDIRIDEAALTYPFSYDKDEIADLAPAMQRHYPDPGDEIGRWARRFVRLGHPTETGHLLMTLCYAIRESFVYARRQEHGTQTPLETLHLRSGTCRDFALLMMEAARTLGLAARFVSGYVYVPIGTAPPCSVAAPRMHGVRSIFPGPGGRSSIRPMASSATAISFAWPLPVIRARQFH